jgi:hypothetical protein
MIILEPLDHLLQNGDDAAESEDLTGETHVGPKDSHL